MTLCTARALLHRVSCRETTTESWCARRARRKAPESLSDSGAFAVRGLRGGRLAVLRPNFPRRSMYAGPYQEQSPAEQQGRHSAARVVAVRLAWQHGADNERGAECIDHKPPIRFDVR